MNIEFLTPRRRELIALVAQGLPDREIAHRMGITTGTVKVMLVRLYRAFAVSNRTALTTKMLRAQW